MPRPTTETVTYEEYADEDRDGECYICGDSTHRKDGTNSNTATKDKQAQENTNSSIEPDGVHGGERMFVDALHPETAREAVVASISEGDSRCGHHAALAHEKPTNNCHSENREGSVFGHHLNKIRGPGLAKV